MTIFIAAQAPELVSRDLRSHVLPLYFSRPIRRGDYPLAKYIALTAALLLLIEVPLLIMYVGTIASAKNGHGVWDETKALIPGLGVGPDVGRADGGGRPGPGLPHRPPRVRDRDRRHLLRPHLPCPCC